MKPSAMGKGGIGHYMRVFLFHPSVADFPIPVVIVCQFLKTFLHTSYLSIRQRLYPVWSLEEKRIVSCFFYDEGTFYIMGVINYGE